MTLSFGKRASISAVARAGTALTTLPLCASLILTVVPRSLSVSLCSH
jgi:hypothetical protein